MTLTLEIVNENWNEIMRAAALVAFTLLVITACGGGGASVSNVVSGVAATGTAFHGTVYLKDSSAPATELSTSTAVDGTFSFDVSALKPPFLRRTSVVGSRNSGSGPNYSFASGAGTANINPLSTLAVYAANGGNDLDTVYAAGDPSKLSAIAMALPESIAKVQTSLQGTLSQFGAGNVNFITGNYAANHQGLDLMFDLISVTAANGTVYVNM